MQKFSIKEAVKAGWELTKQNLGLMVGVVVVVVLVNLLPNMLTMLMEDGRNSSLEILAIPVMLVSWILNFLVSLGMIKVVLNVVDKKKTAIADLFNGYPLLLNYIAGSIIYGLIVVGGFILFIIPGIYFAIKYHFYSYYIVDKKMGPIEAIKASGKITKGIKLHLILFGIVLALLNLLGALLFGIGLLITIPITAIAYAYVYRNLSKSSQSPATT